MSPSSPFLLRLILVLTAGVLPGNMALTEIIQQDRPARAVYFIEYGPVELSRMGSVEVDVKPIFSDGPAICGFCHIEGSFVLDRNGH